MFLRTQLPRCYTPGKISPKRFGAANKQFSSCVTPSLPFSHPFSQGARATSKVLDKGLPFHPHLPQRYWRNGTLCLANEPFPTS